jgi:hypothetical protein
MNITSKKGSREDTHKFHNRDLPFKVTKFPENLPFYAPPPTTNINYSVNLALQKDKKYLVGRDNTVKLECDVMGLKSNELLKDLRLETKLLVDQGKVTASVSPASKIGFQEKGGRIYAQQKFNLCVENRKQHTVHLETSIVNNQTNDVYYIFESVPFSTIGRLSPNQKGKKSEEEKEIRANEHSSKKRKITSSSSPQSKLEDEYQLVDFFNWKEKSYLETVGQLVLNLTKMSPEQAHSLAGLSSSMVESRVQLNQSLKNPQIGDSMEIGYYGIAESPTNDMNDFLNI